MRIPCGFGPRVCGGSPPADEPGLLPRLSIVEDLSQGEMAGSSDVGAAAAVAIETVRRSSGTATGRNCQWLLELAFVARFVLTLACPKSYVMLVMNL